jgi:hypothetical protein
VRFTFSVDPADDGSGLVLGNLEIAGPDGSVSSAGRRPDQSFMVYLGLVDLVDGLTGLADGRRRSYEFVGPDSSFIVVFRRKGERISASAYGSQLGAEPARDVLAGLRAGIDDLLAAHPLDPAEPGAGDVAAAVGILRARA